MGHAPAAIVVIHGLWMNGLELGILRGRLEKRSEWPARAFSYRTVRRTLPENARLLRRYIDETDADTVHIVAHSLGGVLALHMLNLFPTDRVGRIVCLGSPLVDSSAARRLSRWGLGRKIIGRTLRGGVLEQPLISVDGRREVGIIAGSVELGIGVLVGPLESPHDGVVSVRETQLPGVTEHIIMPVNHLGLVFSRKVVDQAVHFLRFGKFQ